MWRKVWPFLLSSVLVICLVVGMFVDPEAVGRAIVVILGMIVVIGVVWIFVDMIGHIRDNMKKVGDVEDPPA
jgi:hypothetical protein